MAGRGPSRFSKVTALPLAGGGAGGGSVNIDVSQFRDRVLANRDADTAMSVADGLAETMAGLDTALDAKGAIKPPLQQFVESLQRVAVEHEKSPAENVIEPYRQAFQKLVSRNPMQADAILRSSNLPEPTVSALSQQGPAKATRSRVESLAPEDVVALQEAQDISAALKAGREMTMGQEMAPNDLEGMQQVPLAQETALFDDTRQGKSLISRLVRLERERPAIEGLSDAGAAYAPMPEGPDAPKTRNEFPYSLSQLMGPENKALAVGMYYRDEAGRAKTPQQIMYPAIKGADNIRLLREMSGQPFVESLPPESSTVGSLTKGKVGSKNAEGSVGDAYSYNIGEEEGVKQALQLIDQNSRRNTNYDPTDPEKINPETGEPYSEFTYTTTLPNRVQRLLEQAGHTAGGRVMLKYGTAANMPASVERKMLNEGRTPLNRRREQLVNIIDGKTQSVPKALQRLIGDESTPADIRTTIEQAASGGGVLPLDEVAPYWRAHFTYRDPVDGQMYMGQLPPEILSPLIAQQLLIDNPGTMQSMVGAVQRSMQIYQQAPPSGRALEFLDENGSPRAFTPSKPYLMQIIEQYNQSGSPIPPIKSRPDGLKRPGAEEFSVSQPRFQQSQFSPLASLVG